MRFTRLDDWLNWQESLHSQVIDLGLERVQQVAQRLFSRSDFPTIITVAGTNGKGSVCANLSSIYAAAGYQVAWYSSPHLLHYNERIRVNGEPVSDDALCESFERIDQARGDTSLTYFEFGTLAAMDIFARQQLDIVILEVGLGGRLDAVNILDADVCVISSIDLDHQSWLGDTREKIAEEKLGICRRGVPLVLGEIDPPSNMLPYCRDKGVPLLRLRHDFAYQKQQGQWQWQSVEGKQFNALPNPVLPGEHQYINAATALMVVEQLHTQRPNSINDLRQGLHAVNLPGRLQHLQYRDKHIVLDVAHNPQATRALAATLPEAPQGQWWAVLGMMEDKAIEDTLLALKGKIPRWILVDLPQPRGATAQHLEQVFTTIKIATSPPLLRQNVGEGVAAFFENAGPDDRLLVFGSFVTVAEALNVLQD